jgi:ribonuclease H / adenosylcobalamin/alpha-ribazole phosphatase
VGGRRLVVEADGGSRGNPGNAGFGALVRDAASGQVIAERAESVGIASNNVAEYGGLIAGLKAAIAIDPAAEITVRLDSKLIVEQMSGRWRIKHDDMRRLAQEAREIVAELVAAGGSVTYTWIPRAENTAADALANSAMDGKPVSWTGTPADARSSSSVDVGSATEGADAAAAEGADAAAADGADGAAADLGAPTRIVLVRHGVTDFTIAGKLDGRGGPDPALNAEGRRQVRAAAARIHAVVGQLTGDGPVQVLTSSLRRAFETGSTIADQLGVPAQVDPDWDEQAFGDWDDKTIAYLAERYPEELQRFREDPQYSRPGGEAQADLQARVVPAFERATAAGGTVVVATHRKPIMTVLAHVLGIPHERAWRLATAPASLTIVEVWDDGGTSVACVNDTSHLPR